MAGKTIVILGGGVGGIATANMLRKQLGAEHRILVVDKRSDYVFTPSLLWVMVGWRRPEQITKSLHRLVRPGVEVLVAGGQEIDPEGGRIKTSNGDLAYDYLVIATGADLDPDVTPGFRQAAHTPYDLDGATGLWSALQRFDGGRVVVLVTSMPYKCPAAPYETALLLDDYLRKQGIRGQCEVELFTPETLPMGVAGPAMGRAVVGMMEAKGIRFNPQLNISRIDEARKELNFSNGAPTPFDLLAGVPAHTTPPVVKESPLANEAGWVPVDKKTLQTSYENIYAIGDVASIPLANGMALPKAGVFAEGQAHTVARRIAGEIRGVGAQAEFDGLGFCWIETGGGSAGFASGAFYAEPDPAVPLPRAGRMWHWGKILFEKYWLGDGATRQLSGLGLNLASKVLGVPVSL
jgi:sulfide:quinone oxidoreductase